MYNIIFSSQLLVEPRSPVDRVTPNQKSFYLGDDISCI